MKDNKPKSNELFYLCKCDDLFSFKTIKEANKFYEDLQIKQVHKGPWKIIKIVKDLKS